MFYCLCGSWLYVYGSGQNCDYEPCWFGCDIDFMNLNQVDLVWRNLLDMVWIVWTWIFWFDFLGLGLWLNLVTTRYVFLHPISQGAYPQSTLPPQQFQPAPEVQIQIFSPNPKTTATAGGNLAKWTFSPQNQVSCSIAESNRLWQNTSDAWDPFSFLLCVVAIVCMTSYKQLGHFGGNCVTTAISRKCPFMLWIRHLDTIPLFPLLEPAFLPGLFCWEMFIHLEFFAWKCFLPGFCLEIFSTWNPSKVQLPNLSQQVCSSKGK